MLEGDQLITGELATGGAYRVTYPFQSEDEIRKLLDAAGIQTIAGHVIQEE